jgi:TPR repeat protein
MLNGFCLERVQGVEKDLKLAAYYYKLSAAQGDARGQHNYGCCLEHGRGVEKDLKLAAYYFKLSADQGNTRGQYNYAHCREKGRGVTMDLILSEQYYKFAPRSSAEQRICSEIQLTVPNSVIGNAMISDDRLPRDNSRLAVTPCFLPCNRDCPLS